MKRLFLLIDLLIFISIHSQNNIVKFKVGNLFGYKNIKTQKIIFEPKYIYAEDFIDGLAIVQEDNGVNSINSLSNFKILKDNGNYLDNEIYGTAKNIGKGLVIIGKLGNKDVDKKEGTIIFGSTLLGILDKDANKILPLEYSSIGSVFDDLIIVSKVDKSMSINYGIINLKGEFIMPLQKDFKINDFQCGVAVLQYKNQKGLINKEGKIIIEPTTSNYISISQFNKFCISEVTTSSRKYGLINSEGKLIAEPIYTRSSGLSDKGVTYKEAEFSGNGFKK